MVTYNLSGFGLILEYQEKEGHFVDFPICWLIRETKSFIGQIEKKWNKKREREREREKREKERESERERERERKRERDRDRERKREKKSKIRYYFLINEDLVIKITSFVSLNIILP